MPVAGDPGFLPLCSGCIRSWKKLFADGGYQGPEFQRALTKLLPQLETEIIKRSDHAKGFVVLPRRWVVERTITCSTAAEGAVSEANAKPAPPLPSSIACDDADHVRSYVLSVGR